MHTTNKLYIDNISKGATPIAWDSGDTFYQKAVFIATTAWSMVKDAADPQLPLCDLTHRENLIGETESIMSGNAPNKNSKFAMKVAELIRNIPKEDLKR